MVLGGCYKGESKGGKSALFQQPPIIKSFVAGFQHIGRSFPVNKLAKLGNAIWGCSHITSAAGGGGGGMANADHC